MEGVFLRGQSCQVCETLLRDFDRMMSIVMHGTRGD